MIDAAPKQTPLAPVKVLSASAKYRIELEANRAARDGFTRNEACPYPFGDAEGKHWTACFLLKGGKL